MSDWKRIVTSNLHDDGSYYVTENITGSASKITNKLTQAEGGLNMTVNASDNGVLVKVPGDTADSGWSLVTPSGPGEVLKWDGTAFGFGNITVSSSDESTYVSTTAASVGFNDLSIYGSLTVEGAAFWDGDKLETSGNIIELNSGGSALAADAGLKVDTDGASSTAYTGLIWDQSESKWVARVNNGSTDTDQDLMFLETMSGEPTSSHNFGEGQLLLDTLNDNLWIQVA